MRCCCCARPPGHHTNRRAAGCYLAPQSGHHRLTGNLPGSALDEEEKIVEIIRSQLQSVVHTVTRHSQLSVLLSTAVLARAGPVAARTTPGCRDTEHRRRSSWSWPAGGAAPPTTQLLPSSSWLPGYWVEGVADRAGPRPLPLLQRAGHRNYFQQTTPPCNTTNYYTTIYSTI